MNSHKRITICADDFALDTAVSSAVVELTIAGRISAVSCFTSAPLWTEAGPQLAGYRDRVLMGLHFNLTQPFDETAPKLRKTILAAVTHRLDPVLVRSHFMRQIEGFTSVVGEPPDFIDGHEHVHAFPVIADVLRQAAEEINPDAPVPIRSVSKFFGPTDAPLKRAVIRGLAAMGGRYTAGVGTRWLNSGFAGDYSLSAHADFAGLFPAWLDDAPDRGLIMCHPRRETGAGAQSAGALEFRYLSSPHFANLLDSHNIRFVRRRDLAEGSVADSPSNYVDRAHFERYAGPMNAGDKI